MSKEQTLTAEAEKWLKERGSQYSSDMVICYHMEQYANAKVLEALEREVKKCINYYGYDEVEQDAYYETQVKPKYKL